MQTPSILRCTSEAQARSNIAVTRHMLCAAGLYGNYVPQTVANFLATVHADSYSGTVFNKVCNPVPAGDCVYK